MNNSLQLAILRELQKQTALGQAALRELEEIKRLLSFADAASINFTAQIVGTSDIKENVTQMDMRADQQVDLLIKITDAKGNPAAVDGIPVWASSDETVIKVTAAVDGMRATAFGVVSGTARVTVQADADLGEGIRNISGVLDFNITPGSAAVITITATAPVDQAPAPSPTV